MILSFTSHGFPYSGSLTEPRPQRHYITHTKRTFYNDDGVVTFSDVGFFIRENEKNSKRTLDSILEPEKLLAKDDDVLCETEAFCGFPSYNTSNAFWMVANDAPSLTKSTLKMTTRLENGNSLLMSFDVVSTLVTLLFVAPEAGVTIKQTSVGFSKHEWIKGRQAHYLKITNGKASSNPFSFDLTLEKSEVGTSIAFKITVVTMDLHFDRWPRTVEFQELINKFPDYTFVQSHQSDVSSYAFK